MTHDELDRILSRKDEIAPSSGFVDSVIDSVRQEAATPPPIPFPWGRAVPGIIAAGVAVVSAVVFFVDSHERTPCHRLRDHTCTRWTRRVA